MLGQPFGTGWSFQPVPGLLQPFLASSSPVPLKSSTSFLHQQYLSKNRSQDIKSMDTKYSNQPHAPKNCSQNIKSIDKILIDPTNHPKNRLQDRGTRTATAIPISEKKRKKREKIEREKEKERRKEWERTGNLHIKLHPVLVPHTQAAHARIQSRNCFASFSSLCCSTQHAIAAAIP